MQEFIDRFPTEASCRQYLVDIKWKGEFICPSCLGTEAWKLGRGNFKCKACRRIVSVTSGTVFQDSHIPLRTWFLAMWSVVSQKQGVSALGLSRTLGVDQKTGWYLLQRIRTAMVRAGRERLSGTVEIDEVFIGGVKPGIGGRGALGKTLILVAVEDTGKGIGRIRIEVIPDASATSLRKAIEKMVEPGSTIRTDEWKGYTKAALKGYHHTIMKRQARSPGEDPTPLVHRVSSLLKRWLLGTHQGGVQTTHLRGYLDEFIFRFNRRTSRFRGLLFYRLVQGMIQERKRVLVASST